MRLNVTRDGDSWWGYIVVNGAAHRVAYGEIDALRDYALANGYEGILLGGGPSVPFFQTVIFVKV
jgi:hypothetical protein